MSRILHDIGMRQIGGPLESRTDRANTRKQVLYIHDDEGTLQFRKLMLEKHGYEVIAATCSREALGAVTTSYVDVVVADHLRNGGSCSAFMAEIKRLRPEVPLILLSDNDQGSLLQSQERGFHADAHLIRPTGEEFLRCIEALANANGDRERRSEKRLPRLDRRSDSTRELLAAIVESSDDAIFSKTLDGIVTSWNQAAVRLYGYPKEEIIGKPVAVLIPQDRKTEIQEIMRRLRAGERIERLETERLRRDGTLAHVTLNISPIYSRDGRLIGASDTAHDMSELKKAEQALRSSERLATAGRLAATVAHEINNPLEVLSNILYLLEQNPSLDSSAREWLHAGEEELRRVMQIARLTLNFHRDKSTKASSVSLPEIVDNVLNLYDRKIRNSGIKIERRFRSRAVVEAVGGEIRQVVSNMIVNAVDALNGKGTRLQVRVAEATLPCRKMGRSALRLTIADDGIGISQNDIKQLFQPFFTTKGDQGTGIGLWVSRGIIEKHGGCIRLRSRNFGQHRGTVFQIFLPLTQDS